MTIVKTRVGITEAELRTAKIDLTYGLPSAADIKALTAKQLSRLLSGPHGPHNKNVIDHVLAKSSDRRPPSVIARETASRRAAEVDQNIRRQHQGSDAANDAGRTEAFRGMMNSATTGNRSGSVPVIIQKEYEAAGIPVPTNRQEAETLLKRYPNAAAIHRKWISLKTASRSMECAKAVNLYIQFWNTILGNTASMYQFQLSA